MRLGDAMRPDRMSCVAALLTGLFLASPGVAGPGDECSCDNLESLQQEYQNALYLEQFFRKASAELKDWETHEAAEKAAGRSSSNIEMTSSAMLKAKSEGDVKLPFPKVIGYTGPERVSMEVGKCVQPKAELDGLRKGSPCFAIAEASLAHEVEHQEICNKMGAAAYWDRAGSEKAIDEADRYRSQAAAMLTEINKVLGRSQISVIGEWPYTVKMEGMETEYHFEFASADINPASDGATGEFVAKGKTSHTLKRMSMQGLNCTGGGTDFHEFTVKMKTDGMTFGLEFDGQLAGGMQSVTCEGVTVEMPPAEGSGWGQFDIGLMPLKAGETKLSTKWTDALMPMGGGFAMSMIPGFSVTGEAKSVLTISCPKP